MELRPRKVRQRKGKNTFKRFIKAFLIKLADFLINILPALIQRKI